MFQDTYKVLHLKKCAFLTEIMYYANLESNKKCFASDNMYSKAVLAAKLSGRSLKIQHRSSFDLTANPSL